MLEVPIDQVMPDQGEGAIMLGESDEARARQERIDRLGVFGATLDKLFRDQVAEKSAIEERWISDLRQHAGEYDDDTIRRIREAGGSESFVNLTRVKCNSTEARLSDTILPTDDRNWSIEPTPKPEMRAGKGAAGNQTSTAAATAELMGEAKQAAELMQVDMDDQLAECGYNAVLRSVLHNSTVYGTGILKGPVIRSRAKTAFKKVSRTDPATGLQVERWTLAIDEDLTPAAESVSPWDFFPDMRATRMEDCEFVFERHRFTKAKLRELAKLPGFMADQIQLALQQEPVTACSGLVDQATADPKRQAHQRGRYEVIEYTGPIEKADLIAAGVRVDEDDELSTFNGAVWFVGGVVIKAVLSMLDCGELMYDVMPLERDDTSVFGFGVPYLMRHSQRAGNSAWRMILDNARLSVGGQVVHNPSKVRPANGDRRVSPLKSWEVTDPNANIADVFAIVDIPANFQEMFKLFEVIRQITDEETGLPMIAQGQQSAAITKTAQGMSILMNSANTVLRRMVKEFDDSVTARFIKRLYHWNMQYGDNEEAKGDHTVLALGSSTLLVREQQTQGLMQLAQLAATNPEFMTRTKWADLYRTIVRAMNINAEGLVKTDDEVESERLKAAQQPQPLPPELQVKMGELALAQKKLQLNGVEMQTRMQIEAAKAQADVAHQKAATDVDRAKVKATFETERMRANAMLEQARADVIRTQVDQQLAMLKIAAEREMTLAQVQADFGLKAMDIDSKHQLFNAEAQLRETTGEGI